MTSTVENPPSRAAATVRRTDTALVFRVHTGEHRGKTVSLRGSKCAIGSAPDCQLRIVAPGVQAVHCYVASGARGAVVRRWADDTALNGRSFDDAWLAHGDRLKIGPVELEFLGPSAQLPPRSTPNPTTTAPRAPRPPADAAPVSNGNASEIARLNRRARRAARKAAQLNAKLSKFRGLVAGLRRERRVESEARARELADERSRLESALDAKTRLLAVEQESSTKLRGLVEQLRVAGEMAAAQWKETAGDLRNRHDELRRVERELDSARRDAETLRQRFEEARKSLQAETEARRLERTARDEAIQRYERDIASLRGLCDDLRRNAALAAPPPADSVASTTGDERWRSILARCDELTESLAARERDSSVARDERDAAQAALNAANHEAAELRRRLDESTGEIARVATSSEESRRLAADLEVQVTALKNTVNTLEGAVAAAQAEAESARRRADEAESVAQSVRDARIAEVDANTAAELAAAREALAVKEAELSRIQDAARTASEQLAESVQDVERLRESEERWSAERATLQAERDALSANLQEQAARFAEREASSVATPAGDEDRAALARDREAFDEERQRWSETKGVWERKLEDKAAELDRWERELTERAATEASSSRMADQSIEADPYRTPAEWVNPVAETPVAFPVAGETRHPEPAFDGLALEPEVEEDSRGRAPFGAWPKMQPPADEAFGEREPESPYNATMALPRGGFGAALSEESAEVGQDHDSVGPSSDVPADETPQESPGDIWARLNQAGLLRTNESAAESNDSARTMQVDLSKRSAPEPQMTLALGASDREDEAPRPFAQPSAPFSPKPPADDEEESIEDYMARLLKRVRGENDAHGSTKPSPEPSRQTGPTAHTVSVSQPSSSEVETPPAPVDVVSAEEYQPKCQAPESSNDLRAMRELAMSSARQALDASADRRHRQNAAVAIIGMAVALAFSAAIVFAASWTGRWNLMPLGIAPALGALFFAWKLRSRR